MDASLVQWAGVIIGSVALVVSIRNILLTQTKNARDATFKMLDRWTADAMREARQKFVERVNIADVSNVKKIADDLTVQYEYTENTNARHALLENRLNSMSPEFLPHLLPLDVEYLRRACDPESPGPPGVPIAYSLAMMETDLSNLIRRKATFPQVLFDFRDWYSETVRLIMKTKIEINADTQCQMLLEAKQKYSCSPAYQIDLGSNSDLRLLVIHVAQVISELKALFDAGVLDRKLTKSLFAQSMSDWTPLINRIVNSRDLVESNWIRKTVAPFPDFIINYEPLSPASITTALVKRIPAACVKRIVAAWKGLQTIALPNSATPVPTPPQG